MDYNPEEKKFTSHRVAFIESGWDHIRLEKFLKTRPDAWIYNTLSHKPGFGSLIEIDGEPYVDMFGLHVYLLSQVSWTFHPDIDERFNYDSYPEDLENELYSYFDWTSTKVRKVRSKKSTRGL